MPAPTLAELLRITEPITAFADGAALLVVIVNYRTARLTIDAVRSLEAEVRATASSLPTRVVVVDNASGDGSAEQIARAIEAHGLRDFALCVPSPHNGGYAYGNNFAIRAALAAKCPPRYFHLLNPDTRAEPGALGALVSFMQAHPDVGIVGSCLLNPDGSDWATAFRFPSVLGELENGVRLGVVSKLLAPWVVARKMGSEPERVDWLPGASMLVRKEVFDAIGLMDEGYFLYYEETDFCLQAKRAGFGCYYVPASKVMHVAGQSTGVTQREGPPRRLPTYVFDSRRRYFVKNYGLGYAALADLLWTAGLASWRLRSFLLRKPETDAPHLVKDAVRNSVLWKRRRDAKRAR